MANPMLHRSISEWFITFCCCLFFFCFFSSFFFLFFFLTLSDFLFYGDNWLFSILSWMNGPVSGSKVAAIRAHRSRWEGKRAMLIFLSSFVSGPDARSFRGRTRSSVSPSRPVLFRESENAYNSPSLFGKKDRWTISLFLTTSTIATLERRTHTILLAIFLFQKRFRYLFIWIDDIDLTVLKSVVI